MRDEPHWMHAHRRPTTFRMLAGRSLWSTQTKHSVVHCASMFPSFCSICSSLLAQENSSSSSSLQHARE